MTQARKSSREQMMAALSLKFPSMELSLGEDFSHEKYGLIWTGEDAGIASDGNQIFHYHAEDPAEEIYTSGVHNELMELLQAHGWYAEWYDCGTVFICPDKDSDV
jgi:hypothetical protein